VVLRSYQRAGYGEFEEGVGPQDHLGVELKFMAFLCHDESVACTKQNSTKEVAALRDAQRQFLQDHLLAWVPAYCERLQREAQEDFYAAAASLTAELLGEDYALLQESGSG